MNAEALIREMLEHSSPEKAKSSAWFFKTGPGQYGEGDKFVGLSVPEQRKLAKKYKDLDLGEIKKLLTSPWHEHRLTALFILVIRYQKSDTKAKEEIASFYLKNRKFVNNWDLVDSSAPYILGDYLTNNSKTLIYEMAKSKSIWDRRIAMLTTFKWIREGDASDGLKIAEILINDKHDLIQKAVGWMLREIGKCCGRATLVAFLDKHAATMPRTSLRYSLEHFDQKSKKHYMELSKKVK